MVHVVRLLMPKPVSLNGAQVLADAGYWDPEQLALADEKGVELYVPDPNRPNPYQSAQAQKETPRIVSISHQNEEIIATCSGGKTIKAESGTKVHKNKDKGTAFKNFTTSEKSECLTCRFRQFCFPIGRKRKTFSSSVAKVTYSSIIQKVADRLAGVEGMQVFSRRMPMGERTFAEVKTTLGMQRFLRRGIEAVKMEWTVICLAFNLRRMHSAMQQV
jgi:hypothetical protein